MINQNLSPISEKTKDRINYLAMRIQILKGHLKKYKDMIDPVAFEYISNDIKINERELEIRKYYLFNL